MLVSQNVCAHYNKHSMIVAYDPRHVEIMNNYTFSKCVCECIRCTDAWLQALEMKRNNPKRKKPPASRQPHPAPGSCSCPSARGDTAAGPLSGHVATGIGGSTGGQQGRDVEGRQGRMGSEGRQEARGRESKKGRRRGNGGKVEKGEKGRRKGSERARMSR